MIFWFKEWRTQRILAFGVSYKYAASFVVLQHYKRLLRNFDRHKFTSTAAYFAAKDDNFNKDSGYYWDLAEKSTNNQYEMIVSKIVTLRSHIQLLAELRMSPFNESNKWIRLEYNALNGNNL